MKLNKLLTLFAAAMMLFGVQSVNAVTLQVVDGTNGGSIARLVDGNNGSKWEGGFGSGQYVILKNAANLPIIPSNYTIVTGNDNASWNGRGWKAWKIYGANFAYDAAASRESDYWVLLDEKTNITQEIVPDVNSTPFDFDFSAPITQGYVYFKIEITELQGANYMQMCEFILNNCTVDDLVVDLLKDFDLTGVDADLATAYNAASAAYDAAGEDAAAAEAALSTMATLRLKINAMNNGMFIALDWAAGNWGDGPGSNLVDKKENTKWGGNFQGTDPQYVIFRGKPMQPFFYKLVTGNDTATNTGRNWKTWKVFGGNFASEAEATKDAEGWVVLDDREEVSEEYLPMKNFYPATFDFNKGVSEAYSYYKVEVYAPHSGIQHQMSEMYLCTQEEFEAIRAPYVEEFVEFADGLDELVVETTMEEAKTTFAELYDELKTTADAVRLTKIYNDLVALREALEASAAFVAGDNAQVLDGNTAWGDNENWTKLVDGNIQTKWGGGMPEGGSYVIFKTYEAKTYNQYMLVTGNDTKNSPDRNWKTWKIYGIAGKVTDSSATRDNAAWTLLDQKTDIGQDRLPGANFAPAYFNFSEEWTKSYKYFKIEVEAAYNNGGSIQMSEFKMLTDEQYEEIRQEYVDSLVKVGTAIAEEYAGATVPDALKQKILAEGQVKAAAVQTAKADDLLPAFAAALNYITVEAPALIAAAQLEKVDGVYQIANAYNLASFAAVVNGGENDADAVVTADIDMTGFEWPAPIGDWTVSGINSAYKGHFDGQGHTISNLVYTTAKNWHGFFGVLTSGALVENFNIAGTITIASGNSNVGVVGFMRDNSTTVRNIKSSLNINNNSLGARVGGIVGTIDAGTATVDRCTYSGTLDGNDNEGNGNYGGIVGYFANNANAIGNITNCLFDGEVINSNASPGSCTFGGIVGYCNAGKATIENCLSIGTVQSKIAAQFFGKLNGNNSTFVNCYYKGSFVNGNGSGGTASGEAPVLVTDEQLASGFVAAKLAPAFRQTLGTDDYPVLDDTKALVAEITDAGYATLFVEDVDLTVPEGVEAFAGVVDGKYLKLNAIEGAVAAGEPVVLKGAAGFYGFVPTTGATKAAANDLMGAAEDVEAAGNYILAKPEGEPVGFYRASAGTIKAGKAYLGVAAPGVKAFLFDEDGATGIANVEKTVENGAIYNIAGQRLNKMQKGINIVNGKKVLF